MKNSKFDKIVFELYKLISLTVIMLCFLSFSSSKDKISISSTDCCVQDSLTTMQIDSILNLRNYRRAFFVKKKISDSSFYYYYYLSKSTKEIVAAELLTKNERTLITYYFIQNKLTKVIFRPKRINNERAGGVYYFSQEHLIYKEEYNIETQSTDKFLKDADIFKSNAKLR